jgi:hypothetical protein
MVVPYIDIDICIVIDVYPIPSITPIAIRVSIDIRISIIIPPSISLNVIHTIIGLLLRGNSIRTTIYRRS